MILQVRCQKLIAPPSHCLCDLRHVLPSTLPLSPSLPTYTLNSKDFWLHLLFGSSSESVLVFLSSSNKDGGQRSGEVRLGDEGQIEIFDSKTVAPSLSLTLKWYSSHTSYCKSLWYDVTMQQIHKDFSHITLQTQTPSPGNLRETFGLPLPLVCLKDQENTVPFSTKIKKENHEKSQPPFFSLLIYCCIQGRGNSERH